MTLSRIELRAISLQKRPCYKNLDTSTLSLIAFPLSLSLCLSLSLSIYLSLILIHLTIHLSFCVSVTFFLCLLIPSLYSLPLSSSSISVSLFLFCVLTTYSLILIHLIQSIFLSSYLSFYLYLFLFPL